MKKSIPLALAFFLAVPAGTAALATPVQAASVQYETKVEWGVNFRSSPSTSNNIIRMLQKGEYIHVIQQVNSYWLQVQTQDGRTGYVSSNSKYTNYSGNSSNSATGTITRGVNFRSAPSVANNIIGSISRGTVVEVLEHTNQWWVKVRHNGRTGYVSTDYISTTGNASPSPAPAPAPSNGTAKADQIIDFAQSLMGQVTYSFGVRNPSRMIFDCSSFTQYVFERYGVSFKWGTRYQKDAGVAVSKSNLQKGDLVFFGTSSRNTINHVGIYMGNGQFIHNTPSKNGLSIDSLNSGYWSDKYISARRVL